MAKIHIGKADFEKALKTVGTCVAPNHALPVSEYIRITTKGNRMKLEASNPVSAIKTYTGMDMPTEDMSFCVNFKDLSRYVAAIDDDYVSMEANIETNCIRVLHSCGDIAMPCINANDFPEAETPKPEDCKEFSIPAEALSNWLQNAKSFTVNDALRTFLAGAYLEGKDGELTVSASDTKVLYNDSMNIASISEPFGAIIPSAAFGAISSVADDAENISVSTNGKKAWFKSQSTTLTISLLVGKYPNVRSIIPAKHEFEAIISRERLRESIKRIGLTIGAQSHVIKFQFNSSGILTLLHENFVDNKTATESLNYEGGIDFSIAFGYESFMKALSAIDSENVVMRMNDPMHMAVLKEVGGSEDKTILVMPMVSAKRR